MRLLRQLFILSTGITVLTIYKHCLIIEHSTRNRMFQCRYNNTLNRMLITAFSIGYIYGNIIQIVNCRHLFNYSR